MPFREVETGIQQPEINAPRRTGFTNVRSFSCDVPREGIPPTATAEPEHNQPRYINRDRASILLSCKLIY